jgi:hypothetical protein
VKVLVTAIVVAEDARIWVRMQLERREIGSLGFLGE